MVWRTPVVFLGVLSILICVISLECDGYMSDGREHVSSREILKFLKEIRNVFCTQVRFPEGCSAANYSCSEPQSYLFVWLGMEFGIVILLHCGV
jgi:hypothetical protein